MRKLFYLGTVLLFVYSCTNSSPTPYCGDLEDGEINWVQETIAELIDLDDKWSYLVEAEYNGEIVYSVQGCNPAALYALIYFRCNGERIEGPYDLDEVKNQRVIWRPDDSPCDFDFIEGR